MRLELENDLVKKAKKSDAAFTEIYNEYFKHIYSYCFNRLGNIEIVESVLGQVFLNAAEILTGEEDVAAEMRLRTWLYMETNSIILDYITKDNPKIDAGQLKVSNEQEELLSALSSLKPTHQEIISLYFFTSLDINEISEIIHIKTEQFKKVFKKALHLLQTKLEESKSALSFIGDGSKQLKLKLVTEKFNKLKLISPTNSEKQAKSFKNDLIRIIQSEYAAIIDELSKKSLFTKLKEKLPVPPMVLIGSMVAIIFVGLAIYYIFNQNNSVTETTTDLYSASLEFIDGDVEYKDNDEAEWQKAESEITLTEGASVRVMKGSKGIVVLDDGSEIRMNSNTEIAFLTLQEDHILIKQLKGDLYSRIIESDRKYEIKIDETIIASAGTAFKTINRTSIKGVVVYQSKVKVVKNRATDNILVTEGNSYYLTNDDDPKLENKVKPISIEDISEDEFILWNKDLDESDDVFKSEMGVLGDIIAPSLTITSPENNSTTTEETIEISGFTESDATVYINGTEVRTDNGDFDYTIDLDEGENEIVIEVVDNAGNKSKKTIYVTREIEPTVAPTQAPTNTPVPPTPTPTVPVSYP